MIETITSFKTTDGKMFDTLQEAEKHQTTLLNLAELDRQVKDLMNQILILLQFVPRAQVRYKSYDDDDVNRGLSSNDGRYDIFNVPEDMRDLRKLASIKDYCMNVTESGWTAESYTEQYYDSTCYNY